MKNVWERDEGTKGRRDEGTKGQRDRGTERGDAKREDVKREGKGCRHEGT